jgi:hypothetical protein
VQIRAGFDITYQCPKPTPMLLALSVHPSRMPDVIGLHRISFDPPIGATEYRDGYGNMCHRIVAPAGLLRISTQVVVSDPGTTDAVVPTAAQHAIQDLPDDALVFLLGRRISSPNSPGRCSVTCRRVGRGSKRSATMCITVPNSATATLTPHAPPSAAIMKAAACAAILPIWRSRCAAA